MLKYVPSLFLFAVSACSGVSGTDLDASTDGSGNDATSSGDTATDAPATDGGSDGGSCTKTTPSGGGGCALGQCLCAGQTTCYAAAEAVACCGGNVTCTSDGGGDPDAGQCVFKHPLVDGGARFCETGNCYCKWTNGESCYSAATAAGCCANSSFVCY